MSDQRISDHLANERTFLAWIRTGVGIMAFGFVVVKFSLFIKEISMVMNKEIPAPSRGYSSVIGIALVAFGMLISLLAYFRYRKVEKQIMNQDFVPSSLLISILMLFIFLAGLMLVVYLLRSI